MSCLVKRRLMVAYVLDNIFSDFYMVKRRFGPTFRCHIDQIGHCQRALRNSQWRILSPGQTGQVKRDSWSARVPGSISRENVSFMQSYVYVCVYTNVIQINKKAPY
jgi:hypothetical protein